MSDLTNEKYLIVPAGPAAPPPFPVGANLEGGPVSPVVSGGRDNLWTVHRLENGNYTLTLHQGGGPRWLSKPMGENVVVELMPLPGEWKISKHEHDTYSIEIPSERWPTRAWTLESTVPGTKVKLGVYELPRRDQLWRLIPLPR